MKFRIRYFCFCLFIGAVFAQSSEAQLNQEQFGRRVAVDGVFNEWQAKHIVATDPAGDAVGAFDLTNVSAISVDKALYLHFDIGQHINLQNGSEQDGTLQLLLDAGDKQLTIDFRARTVTDGSTAHLGWGGKIGFQCLPTFASDRYELKIELGTLDVNFGDLIFFEFSGSDALDQPVPIVVQQSVPMRARTPKWAKPAGTFRVVSQNTLNNGLADPERSPKFSRLIAGINADVYCFQEEWDQQLFDAGAAATLPAGTNCLWSDGIAIATRHALTPLPLVLDRAAAGLITTEDDDDVVIIAAHFKCCGYAGSNEDDLRIQQSLQIVDAMILMLQGEYGERAQNAPVVLIGDYNLVGSRTPLDILNAAGLDDAICRSSKGAAYTWRGLESDQSFWPGRLDLVSTTGFGSVNGRVLDTGQMSDRELHQLRVAKSDSLASDHLMLVADCKFSESKAAAGN